MQEQYGEYTITYDESREKFIASKDGEHVASSEKLAALRTRLDKIGEVRKTFQRFKVLTTGGGNRYEGSEPKIIEHEVTSIVSGDECWIVNSATKQRHKQRLGGYSSYKADTPENREILGKVVDLMKQQNAITDKINALNESATKATVPTGAVTEED